MTNRYETLNVSLQTDSNNNRNESRLSQTIQYPRGPDAEDQNQSDQRVRKFRQLYYRNQKLRKELKVLNSKLNQKLQKVRFPNVKKRAASVDLNRELPNKALQRELQNAYRQIKMYKQQIEVLKIKQETPENYAKLRDMENLIAFRDLQIKDVQEQLKSIKNIKKIQQKRISSQLENEDIKQRLECYEKQLKDLRQKLKQIARKGRRRDEQYKKQQAYLVSLGKKYRIATDQNHIEDAPIQKPQVISREVKQQQFKQVKQQIQKQKKSNHQILKKTQILKKQIKAIRDDNVSTNQKYKQKDSLAKNLLTKIQALNRLIREQQKKPKEMPKNPLITNVEDISIKQQAKQQLDQSFSEVDEPKQPTISKQDLSIKKMIIQMEAGQREWKGKYRKVEHGFGGPADQKFQFSGNLIGLQISLDENQTICGIIFIFEGQGELRYEPVQGKRSNIEVKWDLRAGDKISKISGSFTNQSYLNQLIIVTKKGNSGVFGSASSEPFTFRLSDNERISGVFGSVRVLGNDKKITEIGFWFQKIENA